MVNRSITLESDYEYVLRNTLGNILNLEANFSTMEWAKRDLEIISKELVTTAKYFAAQQGLGGVSQIKDYSINGTPVYINRKRSTGTLIRSIKAEPEGNTVVFWNDANLGRGYYAGHIEYGFHDRSGDPVPARPFMRPAFQAVARASRNDLSRTLESFLKGGLIQNVTAMFATPMSGSYRRAFYNQPLRGPNVSNTGFRTVSGLKTQRVPGAMSKMSEKGTIRRDGNQKGFIRTRDTTRDGITSFTTRYGRDLGKHSDTSGIRVADSKPTSASQTTAPKTTASKSTSENKLTAIYGKASDYGGRAMGFGNFRNAYKGEMRPREAKRIWDQLDD